MLKLGVIGTSAISHHFIEAAHASGEYQLVAVYSRKLETAATFASRYQDIQLFDQLEDFFLFKPRLPCLMVSTSFLKSQLSLNHKNG